MYLKSLEIGGFKSFAKKEELEFATPITAIVGPNGSGKSNVAESFRFVLGEQSIKSMRGKKGEDLIWGGSGSVPRQNRASVKIALNNEKRVFALDFDEIVVERTVFRDGTNEYAINGSKTRLKDVHELLASANIGPSGHHIISQGEADRVLSANPKERREMIEDALGLKIYQYKKTESEKRLKKAEENMAHVESLRKEVAPHLRFLERQVKKIEKTKQLREELEGVYRAYLKREEIYLTHTEAVLAREAEEPEKKLLVLEEERVQAKAKLAQEQDDEKRQLLQELEEKLQTVRGKRQEVLRTIGNVEGQISALERLLREEGRGGEMEMAQVSLQEVEAMVRRVEEDLEGVGEEGDIEHVRDRVRNALMHLRSFLSSRGERKEEEKKSTLKEELESLSKEKENQSEALVSFEKEESKLREEFETLKRSIESEESQGREAERELFRILEEERVCEQALSRIENARATLRRDKEDFDIELREAVALIGVVVRDYMNHEIDASKEEVVSEERSVQRDRRRALEKMKVKLEESGAGSDEEVMKEYQEVRERDEFLMRELEDLAASIEKLEVIIKDLTKELNDQFVSGIEEISTEFNRLFVLMFGGGSASLKRVAPAIKKKKSEMDMLMSGVMDEGVSEHEEEDTEGEEGIEIDVKLPNKRVKGLEMLSGGERALTSIALIFAMSQINPPLFIILDETDAALDEANSRRYGDMIEALSEKSQLILITHNRETMSRAGVLYGVTMGGDGVSKLLSVKLDEAVAVAK